MLEVEAVTTTYGGIVAVREASLRVEPGRIVALIGGNGAGKTTLLHTICGLCRAQQGDIRLDGESLLGKAPHRIARSGVLLVPEGRQILGPLSVRENLELGRLARRGGTDAFEMDLDGVYRLFPRLEQYAQRQAGSLSGGGTTSSCGVEGSTAGSTTCSSKTRRSFCMSRISSDCRPSCK